MIPHQFTSGLQSKASVSLTSLPTDNATNENRYCRTAKWLEYNGSRHASDADCSPDFRFVLAQKSAHMDHQSRGKQPQQQQQRGERQQLVSTLITVPISREPSTEQLSGELNHVDRDIRPAGHLKTHAVGVKHGSEDSTSSSSEVSRTRNAELETRSIAAVAQKRRDEKIKEKRMNFGKSDYLVPLRFQD